MNIEFDLEDLFRDRMVDIVAEQMALGTDKYPHEFLFAADMAVRNFVNNVLPEMIINSYRGENNNG